MKKYLFLTILLCGTANAGFEISNAEIAWQTMNFIDLGQTINTAKDPVGYSEGNPLTRRIIGRNPDVDEVYKVMIFQSVAHYFIMKWVDKHVPASKFIRAAELAYKFDMINNNHEIGLRMRF